MLHDDFGVTQIKRTFFLMNSHISNTPLLRPDEKLRKVVWPSLQKIEFPSVGIDDCLLVCAGFEDRAIETLRRTCEAGRTRFSLGLVSYHPNYQNNRIKALRTISEKAALQTTDFVYDRTNPAGMGEELQRFTRQSNRVFIDISGMSRLLIVQTLVALISVQSQPTTIIYGAAEQYPPSQDEFKQDNNDNHAKPAPSYLSSGIFEIAATPELGSVSMLGEAIRLIAFPSFAHEQLTNLIQELQPTYAEFIHGVPPDQENTWRTEAIRTLNCLILNELRGKKEHKTSTLDYTETLDKLLQIYTERNMFDRLVIAPTGSKMQAVAVGLFRAVLHDVQIVYPTPQTFTEPARYTLGLRQLYKVDLPTEAIKACARLSAD